MTDTTTENVVGAAMLVATAYRLRDEESMALLLARLVNAVDTYIAADKGKPVKPSLDSGLKAQLEELTRDPRYWRDRDPVIVRRVTEGYRTLYPD